MILRGGRAAVCLCKDESESEFVKKRPGTPGLASFFSRAPFTRTNDVADGTRQNGNVEARARLVRVCDAIVQQG